MFGEEAGGETAHEEASEGKDGVGGGNHDSDEEDFVGGEEGEIEKIARNWDSDGESNDAEAGNEEADTERIERSGNRENQQKINGKSDKERASDKFGTVVAEVAGDNGENQHSDSNGETSGDGKLEDIFDKAVFDAGGVVFESENYAR